MIFPQFLPGRCGQFSGFLAGYFRFAAVCIALLLLVAIPGRSDQREIQSALKPVLQKKVVVMRRFYTASKLRFDSQGNLLGKATEGYWASDSVVQIADVLVDKHGVLVIKGLRGVNRFNEATGKFVYVATGERIQISVELDPTWRDVVPVQVVLNKIFTDDLKEVASIMPDYWRCWLFGKAARSKDGSWRCSLRNSQKADTDIHPTALESRKEDVADFARRNNMKIFRVGEEVKPPKVVSKVDPNYTAVAKSLGMQGITTLLVVVDEHGDPHVVGIERPLGGGLDDRAIECVQKWRFSPATRNGEPVAVSVLVEVSYHLY